MFEFRWNRHTESYDIDIIIIVTDSTTTTTLVVIVIIIPKQSLSRPPSSPIITSIITSYRHARCLCLQQ